MKAGKLAIQPWLICPYNENMLWTFRLSCFRPFFVSHFVSLEMSKTNKYQHTVPHPPLSCLVSMFFYPYYIYFCRKHAVMSLLFPMKNIVVLYIAVFGAWKQIHHITFFFHFLGKSFVNVVIQLIKRICNYAYLCNCAY